MSALLKIRNLLLTVLLTIVCCSHSFGQQPDSVLPPPLEDEQGKPDENVPAIKKDVTEPFMTPEDKTVLDGNVTVDEHMQPLDPELLPGYDSEVEEMWDEPAPSPEQSLGDEPTETARQLTRREKRRLRKEAKNTPLDLPELRKDAYRITSGRKSEIFTDSEVVISADSLTTVIRQAADSLGLQTEVQPIDSLNVPAVTENLQPTDSVATTQNDSLSSMSPRQRRELLRMQRRADTMLYRHSPLFRDTIKLSPLTAISFVVPGFGQLYNGDYWKIPALYATTGASLYFGIQQNKLYRRYKGEYEYLMSRTDFSQNRALIDPVQTKMIQHNTWQQVFFGAAICSYLYFIGDAVLNYPEGAADNVKIATTLSTIFPGAGQFYNKSYWKGPLILGGFASLIYVIDWNNRGYQRFDRAIRLETDNDPDSHSDEFWNGSSLTMSIEQMRSYKKLYRRNRDLSIIITAAFYLLNIMDAHVDAHMKDFDIDDNLSWQMRLQPTMDSYYTTSAGYTNTFGLGLSITF